MNFYPLKASSTLPLDNRSFVSLTPSSVNDAVYYLWLNEVQAGPLTMGQIRAMWNMGQITALTLFWREHQAEWEPLQKIRNQIESPAPLPVAPAPRKRAMHTLPDRSVALEQTIRSTILTTASQTKDAANRLILFQAQKKSAGAASMLNLFLPGMGYVYAGKTLTGLIVFLTWGFFIFLGLFTFGLGALPAALIWFVGIIDGFIAVNSANEILAEKMTKQTDVAHE